MISHQDFGMDSRSPNCRRKKSAATGRDDAMAKSWSREAIARLT